LSTVFPHEHSKANNEIQLNNLISTQKDLKDPSLPKKTFYKMIIIVIPISKNYLFSIKQHQDPTDNNSQINNKNSRPQKIASKKRKRQKWCLHHFNW